jgi:hypothetical protein
MRPYKRRGGSDSLLTLFPNPLTKVWFDWIEDPPRPSKDLVGTGSAPPGGDQNAAPPGWEGPPRSQAR